MDAAELARLDRVRSFARGRRTALEECEDILAVCDALAAKDAQIARLTQERDWQYEENVSLIAKAGTEAYETAQAKGAQIAALEEKVAILEAEIRIMRKLPSAIDAALEMSGGVK